MALFVYLDDYARTLGSREQLAVAEFAEALLIIPKVLALNAAKDATELLAKLRMYHNAAQRTDVNDEKKKALKYSGLELMNGKVRNNLANGVIEPAMSKVKSLRFATEAAITTQGTVVAAAAYRGAKPRCEDGVLTSGWDAGGNARGEAETHLNLRRPRG